jgi:hypothetical protein
MFVLSVGMPKSGSTLLSLYQKGVLKRLMPNNGQAEFEQLIKEGKVNGIGIFVHDIESPETLGNLVDLSKKIGPFVVKTHSSLTNQIRDLILNKQILATYIHRDPRDVILSAIDHGTRSLLHPAKSTFFLQFDTVQNSIPIVKGFCRTGIEWVRSGLCETYTYHDLLMNPVYELNRFTNFINIEFESSIVMEVINSLTINPIKGKKQYNTGKLLRYPDEMSHNDIVKCNLELLEELEFFGYQRIKNQNKKDIDKSDI